MSWRQACRTVVPLHIPPPSLIGACVLIGLSHCCSRRVVRLAFLTWHLESIGGDTGCWLPWRSGPSGSQNTSFHARFAVASAANTLSRTRVGTRRPGLTPTVSWADYSSTSISAPTDLRPVSKAREQHCALCAEVPS